MPKDDEPRVEDDLETAQAKSKASDERAPQPDPISVPVEGRVGGAPGAFVPQLGGVGLPGTLSEPRGPGEQALELEESAKRAEIRKQRG